MTRTSLICACADVEKANKITRPARTVLAAPNQETRDVFSAALDADNSRKQFTLNSHDPVDWIQLIRCGSRDRGNAGLQALRRKHWYHKSYRPIFHLPLARNSGLHRRPQLCACVTIVVITDRASGSRRHKVTHSTKADVPARKDSLDRAAIQQTRRPRSGFAHLTPANRSLNLS